MYECTIFPCKPANPQYTITRQIGDGRTQHAESAHQCTHPTNRGSLEMTAFSKPSLSPGACRSMPRQRGPRDDLPNSTKLPTAHTRRRSRNSQASRAGGSPTQHCRRLSRESRPGERSAERQAFPGGETSRTRRPRSQSSQPKLEIRTAGPCLGAQHLLSAL